MRIATNSGCSALSICETCLRCHVLEVPGFVNFLDYCAQNTLDVVMLAEKAPVEGIQPKASAFMQQKSCASQQRVKPASLPQDLHQRLISVKQQLKHTSTTERDCAIGV